MLYWNSIHKLFDYFLQSTILEIHYFFFSYYGHHWRGYERHRKSNFNHCHTNRSYNSFANNDEISSHDQNRCNDNPSGLQNSQVPDSIGDVVVNSNEPSILITTASVRSETNERTSLLL